MASGYSPHCRSLRFLTAYNASEQPRLASVADPVGTLLCDCEADTTGHRVLGSTG
jgi:hypothetical protein